MVKQEMLNEKQQMLSEAWNQLNSVIDRNFQLQEELSRRDGIFFSTLLQFTHYFDFIWVKYRS